MLVVSVVNIFSVPFFVRHLGPEMYALWFYVITFSGMFGFSDLGIGSAVGRYIGVALGKGDHQAVREYWGTGNLIALPLLAVSATLFAILGVWFGPKWFNVSPEHVGLLRGCFVAGGFGLFLNFYAQLWSYLSQAHLDFKYASVVRMASTLIQLLPSIAIAWVTPNPFWIICWGVVVSVAQLVVMVAYARRRYGTGFEFGAARMARAREMASFTAKTFATLVAGSFLASIDRVVLGKYASSTEFTHYTVSGNVGMRLQSLGSAVMGPVFHNTSRAVGQGKQSSAAAIFDEMFFFMFGWYLLAAIWAAVWHPVLLRLWLGQDLGAQIAPLFPPLVLAYCITAMGGISSVQLAPMNQVGVGLCFNIATGLLTAAGVWFGWRMGGLEGAVYGFLASRVVFILQDLYVIRLVNARGWLASQVWRQIAAQGLVGALFSTAYLFAAKDSYWLLILAALHGSCVAAWLLRVYLRRYLWTSRPANLAETP